MPRTLLVTNDFPPRTGGIQTYLHALALRLPPGELVVHAPAWPGAAEFDAAFPHPVHRHPTSLMLPGPPVARRALALARRHRVGTVWFGAAAPLGLLGPVLRRAGGVRRVVASTHGHETGWALLPGARGALRRIGSGADVVTTISDWTRCRVAGAFGPHAALETLRGGIDPDRFRPDPAARARLRARLGLKDAPVVVCVSRLVPRKGQDALVRALPAVRARVPGARLLLVGDGPDAPRLRRLAAEGGLGVHQPGAAGAMRSGTGPGTRAAARDAGPGAPVVLTGAVPEPALPVHHAVGDVFAMPCRTRRGGLDVEGLGIALLEAAACGLPVVAGRSGGAPETVREGVTGHVVDGRDPRAVAAVLAGLLADPARAAAMGAAGRAWMRAEWTWDARAARLGALLAGDQE